jgi:BAAT / Acyl-CoA thioester hydrolase C terminal
VMESPEGRYFSSVAEFHVSDDEFNTAKLAPTRGSYRGVEPEGYLWSMTETSEPPADLLPAGPDRRYAIRFRLETQKDRSYSGELDRDFGFALVTTREVGMDGIAGKLFQPRSKGRGGRAIVILSDADPPTFNIPMSYLLASRGHVVLSLAYFGTAGLPAELKDIPIEYFSRAIDVLRRDAIGDETKVVVLAFGRATEAAAMLALHRDDVERIILVSPSSVLNASGETGSGVEAAAWTLNGAPLAFMPRAANEEELMARQQPPYKTRASFELRLARLTGDDPARIPFERIRSDVFLLACDGDDVWPSDRMTRDILGEAGRNGRKNITGQILPGCGHDLSAPISPTTAREYVGPNGLLYSLGGTARSAWYGQRATWLAVLKSIGAQD